MPREFGTWMFACLLETEDEAGIYAQYFGIYSNLWLVV